MELLWNADGDVHASRCHDLGTPQIKELLRNGDLQFVVANTGSPLEWIPPQKTFYFWTNEVKSHIAEPNSDGFMLEDFPDEYVYCASLWRTADDAPIVLLEMHH